MATTTTATTTTITDARTAKQRGAAVAEWMRLVDGLSLRARLPRGFGLWSETFQLAWLRQNQRKDKTKNERSK
jgi:hypothetical protein